MRAKDIIEIDSIANFEKVINEDGRSYGSEVLLLPGTLSERYRGILQEGSPKAIRTRFYSLFIISEGFCEILIGGATQEVTSDYLVILSENSPYTINKLQHCKGYCLHFNAELLRPVLAGHLNDQFPYFNRDSKHIFRLTARESRLIQNCLKDIIRAFEQKSLERESLIRDFTHILLLHIRSIYRTFSNSVPSSTNRADILATRFLHFVEQNFKSMRSVQQYADLLNISPNYLTIVVKKVLGRTPQGCIQSMLLLEAKSLLMTTDKTISEIAYHLCFTDQSHFSNFIKKHTGSTPLDLRNKA